MAGNPGGIPADIAEDLAAESFSAALEEHLHIRQQEKIIAQVVNASAPSARSECADALAQHSAHSRAALNVRLRLCAVQGSVPRDP